MDQPADGIARRTITRSVDAIDDRAVMFDRLAREHLDQSYRLARAILGHSGEAEDAVHDAFEAAWRKWHTLRDPLRFRAWFGRIVVNSCRSRLRHAARRRHAQLDERVPADDGLSSTEVRDELDRALARLRPEEQVVLALRYYEDLGIEDIATLLDVRPGTVGSRIHRAQARLCTYLTAHEDRQR